MWASDTVWAFVTPEEGAITSPDVATSPNINAGELSESLDRGVDVRVAEDAPLSMPLRYFAHENSLVQNFGNIGPMVYPAYNDVRCSAVENNPAN